MLRHATLAALTLGLVISAPPAAPAAGVDNGPIRRPVAAASGTTSDTLLVASAYRYDFGEVSLTAGVVDTFFMVRNESSEPVTLQRVFTSCMCTTVTLQFEQGEPLGPFGMWMHGTRTPLERRVEPGEPFLVRIRWDPSVHIHARLGPVKREVRIESAESTPITFVITAIVVQ